MTKLSEYDAAMKLDEIFDPRCEGEVAHVNMFRFVDAIFEVAFGDDAIYKGFTPLEVIERLHTFSAQSHFLETDAAPMLKIVNDEGGEDWWEADLSDVICELENLGL